MTGGSTEKCPGCITTRSIFVGPAPILSAIGMVGLCANPKTSIQFNIELSGTEKVFANGKLFCGYLSPGLLGGELA